uniref:imelysin family protein n=1 Tax=Alloprevotella sp. TaxID=1872471 RepID=UPI003FF01374
MKKTFILGAALAAACAFTTTTFTSCDNNDDPVVNPDKTQDDADLDYSASNATAWGNYMKNVAALLKSDAEKLYSQWAESYENAGVNTGVPYATLFKNHDSRSGYSDVKSCAQEVVEKMAEIANEVGSSKIGDPYAKWTSGKQTEALYAVESWYSWHSRDDYTNNIKSIANAYYGKLNGSETNMAAASMAKALEGTAIDRTVRKQIADAQAAIQNITQPFRNHIGSTEAQQAMEACAALQASLSEVTNDDNEVEAGAAAVNLRDAVNKLDEATLQAIINNYVDNVVVPTYKNLKDQNAILYQTVNAFVANPSNDGFEACATAWMNARQPWETSEAFLFGPVATFGLDPNMDSWPLDQTAIVDIMKSQKWNSLVWADGDDDAKVESAQNVRGFHTLEFLIFKNGQPRTISK